MKPCNYILPLLALGGSALSKALRGTKNKYQCNAQIEGMYVCNNKPIRKILPSAAHDRVVQCSNGEWHDVVKCSKDMPCFQEVYSPWAWCYDEETGQGLPKANFEQWLVRTFPDLLGGKAPLGGRDLAGMNITFSA